MKIRFIAIAAVAALTTSAAFADPPSPVAAEPAPRAQTLVTEIAAAMRDVLRTVTPEISLPAVEVKLPAIELRR